MAEDLRLLHTAQAMNEKQAMIDECERQAESCLYVSTTCFEWVKSLRIWRALFVVAPIILGGVGAWPILTKSHDYGIVAAVCTLAAGVFPAIFKAIGLDGSVQAVAKQANQYKILQDRFRHAATITAVRDDSLLREEFDQLMRSMDDLRLSSLVPPERFFKKARRKIEAGHYKFAIDEKP